MYIYTQYATIWAATATTYLIASLRFYRSTVESHIISSNDGCLFKAARDDAERQICEKLTNKLEEFLELENYDWTLTEPQGHASSFITDLIAFLRSTFESFTNLPVIIEMGIRI